MGKRGGTLYGAKYQREKNGGFLTKALIKRITNAVKSSRKKRGGKKGGFFFQPFMWESRGAYRKRRQGYTTAWKSFAEAAKSAWDTAHKRDKR